MRFYSENKPGRVAESMPLHRWPVRVLLLYVLGMAYAEAICHPPPLLFNNRLAISDLEIINQISRPVPVFAPNDLIYDLTFPHFVNGPGGIIPAIDDYNPLSPGGKWSGFKKSENIPSQ